MSYRRYQRLNRATIDYRRRVQERREEAAREKDRRDRQSRGIPQVVTGKGGRYKVDCYHLGDHCSKSPKWFRIGWKLTKQAAIDVADSVHIPAIVQPINGLGNEVTYRNAESRRVHDRR